MHAIRSYFCCNVDSSADRAQMKDVKNNSLLDTKKTQKRLSILISQKGNPMDWYHCGMNLGRYVTVQSKSPEGYFLPSPRKLALDASLVSGHFFNSKVNSKNLKSMGVGDSRQLQAPFVLGVARGERRAKNPDEKNRDLFLDWESLLTEVICTDCRLWETAVHPRDAEARELYRELGKSFVLQQDPTASDQQISDMATSLFSEAIHIRDSASIAGMLGFGDDEGRIVLGRVCEGVREGIGEVILDNTQGALEKELTSLSIQSMCEAQSKLERPDSIRGRGKLYFQRAVESFSQSDPGVVVNAISTTVFPAMQRYCRQTSPYETHCFRLMRDGDKSTNPHESNQVLACFFQGMKEGATSMGTSLDPR